MLTLLSSEANPGLREAMLPGGARLCMVSEDGSMRELSVDALHASMPPTSPGPSAGLALAQSVSPGSQLAPQGQLAVPPAPSSAAPASTAPAAQPAATGLKVNSSTHPQEQTPGRLIEICC